MTFKLVLKRDAKKKWDSLDSTVRSIFAKKLKERIEQPRIESARLSGMKDCYKIKLRRARYRLVYQVRDKELIVSVIVVGKTGKKPSLQGGYQKNLTTEPELFLPAYCPEGNFTFQHARPLPPTLNLLVTCGLHFNNLFLYRNAEHSG